MLGRKPFTLFRGIFCWWSAVWSRCNLIALKLERQTDTLPGNVSQQLVTKLTC